MTDRDDEDGEVDGAVADTDLPMVRLMTTISPTADLLMLDVSRRRAETLRDRTQSSLDGELPYTGVRFELSQQEVGAISDGLSRLIDSPAANTARVDLTDGERPVTSVVVSVDQSSTEDLRDDLGGHAGDGDWVVQTQENALSFFLVQLEAALDGADDPLRAAADELGLDFPG